MVSGLSRFINFVLFLAIKHIGFQISVLPFLSKSTIYIKDILWLRNNFKDAEQQEFNIYWYDYRATL